MAAVILCKNLSKFVCILNGAANARKRNAFLSISMYDSSPPLVELSSTESLLLSEVENKLHIMVNNIKVAVLKSQIKAWRQLQISSELKNTTFERNSRIGVREKQKGGRKDVEWK